MKKKSVIFCSAEPREKAAVPERYHLSDTYAFEYLAAYALKNKTIADNVRFEISSYGYGTLDEDAIFDVAMKKPFMVGFSCSTENYDRAMNVARQIKLARPETLIVLGGPEAFAGERLMRKQPFVDCLVIGEGERTFTELLVALLNGKPVKGIKGLMSRNGDKIIAGEIRPPMKSLSSIPSIFKPDTVAALSGIVLYESARGCSRHCAYCLWSPYPKRYFPMSRVRKELGALVANKKITRIWFIDSELDSEPERIKEILKFVKENKHEKLQISGFMGFDNLDDELLGLAAELFFQIPIGLQSVNAKVLRAIGRSWFSVSRFEKIMNKALTRINPETFYIDIMYGLPGDTRETFLETLMWCVKRGLGNINFFRMAIFPGAPIENAVEKYGYVADPEPPHLVYSSSSFSYDDIVRMELAIVNYKILYSIFGAGILRRLAQETDLPGILDALHQCADDYEEHFTYVNESDIMNIDTRALEPHVMAFLRKRIGKKTLVAELEARMKS